MRQIQKIEIASFFWKIHLKSSRADCIFCCMSTNTEKRYLRSLSIPVMMILLLLGICGADRLARSAGAGSVFSESLRQEKRELMPLFLNPDTNPARHYRSSRQRQGGQGRVFNTRSRGSADDSLQPFNTAAFVLFPFYQGKGPFAFSVKEYDFLTNFIISALPVRAGPVIG